MTSRNDALVAWITALSVMALVLVASAFVAYRDWLDGNAWFWVVVLLFLLSGRPLRPGTASRDDLSDALRPRRSGPARRG